MSIGSATSCLPTSTPTITQTPTATPAVCGVRQYAGGNVPRTICPGCTITSTLTIPSGIGSIADLDVTGLNVASNYLGLFEVRLTSPAGTTAVMIYRVCNSWGIPSSNFTLDDEAAAQIGSVCPPDLNGTYKPSNPLSAFDAQDPAGTWTLTVQNDYSTNGSLNAWGLRVSSLCPTQTATRTNTSTPTYTRTATPTSTRTGTPVGGCSVSYLSFSDVSGLALVGSAAGAGSALRLTTNAGGQAGSAWYANNVNVYNGFNTTFEFQLGDFVGGGADGFSFNVHQLGTSPLVGETGTSSYLSVQFDTWQNAGEPSSNFVRINYLNNVLAQADLTPLGINLKDGLVHFVSIGSNGVNIQVSIDSTPVVSATGLALASMSPATVGFGARTGGSSQRHDLLSWWFSCVAGNTPTPAGTSTPTATSSATRTGTPTNTPTSVPTQVLVGHVTWQGPQAQPNVRQQLPITLTLKLGAAEVNYTGLTTNATGSFTVPVGSLSVGTYNWRVKGPRYLANSGTVSLSGAQVTNVELGLMRAGDANNDNISNAIDFSMLRNAFGGTTNLQADFNNDGIINSIDFTLLRGNFGQGGAPPLIPDRVGTSDK